MKRSLRIGLGFVALIAIFAFAEVSAAGADGFSGTFRGPHGQFSIHIGSPAHPVGSYVPYGHRVYRRPRYGYGFDAPISYCRVHRIRHAHWIPVRPYQRRWLVVERPVVYVERPYYGDDRYDSRVYVNDNYYGDSDRRYDRDDRRDDRRYGRDRNGRSKRHKHSRHCDHDDDD